MIIRTQEERTVKGGGGGEGRNYGMPMTISFAFLRKGGE